MSEAVVDSAVEVTPEATERKTRQHYNITDVEFVNTWQGSASAGEVATKLNMPKNIVLARSAVYRKRGVHLKKMERKNPRKLDVNKLNSLISGESKE